MALDMRMIDPNAEDDPNNKASHCAKMIAEYYRKYDAQKGTQFVFSDLGTYKPGEWNVYSEIKRKLIEDYGIPAHEIRFIQECKTERSRKAVIEAMNSGDVRVLFGSTTMLGTGVNAQQRCVAYHHLDTPWRPSDLQQRDGRAVRAGNEIAKLYADNKVDIIIYAVEKSPGLLQVQSSSLQGDIHRPTQIRRTRSAYNRRGCNGREERHELLGIHGYLVG